MTTIQLGSITEEENKPNIILKMAHNLLSNTGISDRYDLRKQAEKLQPIGKEIFETYEHIRLNDKTIILKKKSNETETQL